MGMDGAVFDGLETWERLPIWTLANYWTHMYREPDRFPLAWIEAPTIGPKAVRVTALIVTTVNDRSYKLPSHYQFYRIMFRDGYLLLIFENGREEIILDAYYPLTHKPPSQLGLILPFKRVP